VLAQGAVERQTHGENESQDSDALVIDTGSDSDSDSDALVIDTGKDSDCYSVSKNKRVCRRE
jgi:hypothetical protein